MGPVIAFSIEGALIGATCGLLVAGVTGWLRRSNWGLAYKLGIGAGVTLCLVALAILLSLIFDRFGELPFHGQVFAMRFLLGVAPALFCASAASLWQGRALGHRASQALVTGLVDVVALGLLIVLLPKPLLVDPLYGPYLQQHAELESLFRVIPREYRHISVDDLDGVRREGNTTRRSPAYLVKLPADAESSIRRYRAAWSELPDDATPAALDDRSGARVFSFYVSSGLGWFVAALAFALAAGKRNSRIGRSGNGSV